MAARHELAVWLDDVHVATLDEPRSRQLRLGYTEAAVRRFGVGATVISASLPVRPEPYSVGDSRPVLEGLLPEGEARTRVEHQLGIPRGDTYELLAAIGKDCAGAVVILPPGEVPVRELGDVRPLTTEGLADELGDLVAHPLGITDDVRLSLAGMMDKLLLAELPDGRWGRPVNGAPSTHILKPEPGRYPGLARLEAYGLALARAAGLRTAEARVVLGEEIGSTSLGPYLAVTRYDREVLADGSVRRIHQEDFCQATGRMEKYESEGGPSYLDVTGVLRRFSTAVRDDLSDLVRAMAMTVAVGNADAHGRNLSMLYDGSTRRLAPLYDIVPTTSLAPAPGHEPLNADAGMLVNGIVPLPAVTGADLVTEAISWRMPKALARTLVETTVSAVAGNAARLAKDLDVPVPARDIVTSRCQELLSSL
jgi:serine/threonine-protein kinase HipA